LRRGEGGGARPPARATKHERGTRPSRKDSVETWDNKGGKEPIRENRKKDVVIHGTAKKNLLHGKKRQRKGENASPASMGGMPQSNNKSWSRGKKWVNPGKKTIRKPRWQTKRVLSQGGAMVREGPRRKLRKIPTPSKKHVGEKIFGTLNQIRKNEVPITMNITLVLSTGLKKNEKNESRASGCGMKAKKSEQEKGRKFHGK